MRLGLLPKNRRRITKTQRPLTLSEKSRRSSSHQGGDIGPNGEQATVAVAESESAMSLRGTHAVLKERVIVDSRRSDFFVGPALEDRHYRRLNGPSEPCFQAAVITHARRNPGKWFRHKKKASLTGKKNPLPSFSYGSGFAKLLIVIPVYSLVASSFRITI